MSKNSGGSDRVPPKRGGRKFSYGGRPGRSPQGLPGSGPSSQRPPRDSGVTGGSKRPVQPARPRGGRGGGGGGGTGCRKLASGPGFGLIAIVLYLLFRRGRS